MGKRLVVCCDGTWNTPDQQAPTNVTKLALAIAERDPEGLEQRVFYHAGVGTRRWERLRGGAFGVGLSRAVRECYRFLVENFEPGDEIFLTGFSRGAFTARSAAGLVRNSGVLRRQHADRIDAAYALYRQRGERGHPRGTEAQLFRRSYSHEPRIRFIGVWDTVGALGVPRVGLGLLTFLNRRWEFHDTSLSTRVDLAYQALAIDERRRPFSPTLWSQQQGAEEQVLEQVWFAGVHSDVGGGYPEPELAEIPLLWLVDRARAAGLAFADGRFGREAPADAVEAERARRAGEWVRPDPAGTLHDSRTGVYRLLRAALREPGADVRDTDEVVRPSGQSAASSARERLQGVPGYAPAALVSYVERGGAITDTDF